MSTTMKVAKLPKSGTDRKQSMLTADQFSSKLTSFLAESFGANYYFLPAAARNARSDLFSAYVTYLKTKQKDADRDAAKFPFIKFKTEINTYDMSVTCSLRGINICKDFTKLLFAKFGDISKGPVNIMHIYEYLKDESGKNSSDYLGKAKDIMDVMRFNTKQKAYIKKYHPELLAE